MTDTPDEPTETREQRKLRLNRESQRRCRARGKAGRKLVAVEVDDVNTAAALVADGDLDPARDDDAAEVRRALERAIKRWAARHA